MPNYGLQISADFQPFTLNELLPMVMGATQSLKDVEDAYAKQQTEADQLGYIADILEKEGSDESRMMAQRYRDYQAQIEAGRNELMETGKISRGRKALWESTRDYAKNILPMKTGYEQLAATMKEEAAHPEIARQHRATFSDLPSYIKDPFGVSRVDEKGMPIYGSVDLDKAYKLASDKYSAIANALQWDKGEKEWDDYTDILFKQYGFSVDDIKRYKAAWDSGEFNPKDVLSQIAKDIYDSTMQSLGVDYQIDPITKEPISSWDDFKRIHNTVFDAVYSAMGKGTNELVSRWEDQQNYKASQKDENTPTPVIGTKSYLNSSGKEASYMQLIEGMFPQEEGITAANSPEKVPYYHITNLSDLYKEGQQNKPNLFGDSGVANAMKAYEDLQEAVNENSTRHKELLNMFTLTEAEEKMIAGEVRREFGNAIGYGGASESLAKKQADKYVKNREIQLKNKKILPYLKKLYNVSRFLTKSEYDMLTDLNYNSSGENDTKSKEELLARMNSIAQIRTAYSINLADYDDFNFKFIPKLRSIDRGKKFKALIYEVDNTGRRGDAVDFSDLKIDSKDNPVVDISYMNPSDFNGFGKAKCIIRLKDGAEYLVPLDVIDSRLSNAVSSFEEIGIGKDGFKNDTEKANYITELIANWLSGDYTQMKPKTNAKVQ